MSLFHRKNKLERLLETLESNDMLKSTARTAVESAVANATSPRQAKKVGEAFDSLDLGKAAKATSPFMKKAKSGLVLVAGAAALTAVSASVSSLRHRESSA